MTSVILNLDVTQAVSLRVGDRLTACPTLLELARPLLRPALHHHLLLGEELHRIHPLAV